MHSTYEGDQKFMQNFIEKELQEHGHLGYIAVHEKVDVKINLKVTGCEDV
jgi:hypothetical protein